MTKHDKNRFAPRIATIAPLADMVATQGARTLSPCSTVGGRRSVWRAACLQGCRAGLVPGGGVSVV